MTRHLFLNYLILAPLFILLSCTIIAATFLSPLPYQHVMGTFNPHHTAPLIYFVTASVFCYLFLPYFIGTFILHISPKDMGLRLPKMNLTNTTLTLLAILLLVPFGYLFGHSPTMQAHYRQPELTLLGLIAINFLLLPIYYFAEEFFYRGFLFLTLTRLIGWHSYWITDIMFTFAHVSKPLPEILLCIPASIILNYLTARAKSFLPAFVVHMLLGQMLNVIVWVN